MTYLENVYFPTELPSIEKVIVVPFLQEAAAVQESLGRIPNSILLGEFLRLADGPSVSPSAEFVFAQVPFNHPLFILFSSGTTGPPKCIVHSVGVRRPYLSEED